MTGAIYYRPARSIASRLAAEYRKADTRRSQTMGFLSGKDWNVVAITFERADLYRINGNRAKGQMASKIRDNVKRHARTIHWAIFDQKGKLLESDAGPGVTLVGTGASEKLAAALVANESIQAVLEALHSGPSDKAARLLTWDGYPAKAQQPAEEEPAPAANASQATPKSTASRAAAAPSGVATAAGTRRSLKLVVAAEDGGDEFESSLQLVEASGTLSGVLVAPDGEQVPTENTRLEGDRVCFDVTFGSGEDAVSLKFEGNIAHDVVRGTFG
jgi:hypothetical protein